MVIKDSKGNLISYGINSWSDWHKRQTKKLDDWQNGVKGGLLYSVIPIKSATDFIKIKFINNVVGTVDVIVWYSDKTKDIMLVDKESLYSICVEPDKNKYVDNVEIIYNNMKLVPRIYAVEINKEQLKYNKKYFERDIVIDYKIDDLNKRNKTYLSLYIPEGLIIESIYVESYEEFSRYFKNSFLRQKLLKNLEFEKDLELPMLSLKSEGVVKLQIENGDEKPLNSLKFSVVYLKDDLVFKVEKGEEYSIIYPVKEERDKSYEVDNVLMDILDCNDISNINIDSNKKQSK